MTVHTLKNPLSKVEPGDTLRIAGTEGWVAWKDDAWCDLCAFNTQPGITCEDIPCNFPIFWKPIK